MKDIRLVEILKTFSDEEIKSFEKFLLSPFVKSRRNIGVLLDYFKKFHPDYKPQLSKEIIFKALFPDESYNEKKMVNLIFDLTKAAESFLMHNTIENDEIESLVTLCKGYYDKKLLNQSMRVIQTIENKMKPSFSTKKNYFKRIREVENVKIAYYEGKDDQENAFRSYDRLYEASALQFLIDYTLMTSDRPTPYTYYQNIENSIIEYIAQSFDMNKFLGLINNGNSNHKFLISIVNYILKTINEPDNLDYFYLLKKLIFKNLPDFDRDEKRIVLTHLCNFAIGKSNSGMLSFKREIFEIYLKMLEHNAYTGSESENLQTMAYRNILSIAIEEKESFKFIENFIEKNVNKLNPEEIIDIKNYSYACLYFYKKDYAKAIEKISEVKHSNPMLNLDYRCLILRIYYELNYLEQAFSSIDSFKHFFKSHEEISEPLIKECKKFVKIYSDLLKIKSGGSNVNPFIVKKKFENLNVTICRNWLIEKIDELIGKKDS